LKKALDPDVTRLFEAHGMKVTGPPLGFENESPD
jgi:hypothetical protein